MTGGETAQGGASSAGKGGTANGGANAGGQNTGGAGGGVLIAPPFEDVPMCTASKTDQQGLGPFYIHDGEKSDDISLFRQDVRGKYNQDAPAGVDLELHLRILDSTNTSCNAAAVSDVEVYIWHCDAQGFYAGFGVRGTSTEQKPDRPFSGTPSGQTVDNTDRFCRGAQITNQAGIVSFRTIFPGWYNSRDIHIHLIALKRGSMPAARRGNYSGGDHLFTTQLYFEPDLTRTVHTSSDPYKARTSIQGWEDGILANETGNSGLRFKASLQGSIVVAQMQILLDPKK